MSKLDWTKSGLRSSDPGRVVDVGDYGVLPDRLAGRKGNPIIRQKNVKIKTVKPVNLPNSGNTPSRQSKKSAKASRLTKKNMNGKQQGGLTIPELVSRAKVKVDKVVAEIQRCERKLVVLREQLKAAERQLQIAQNTPRRSVAGRASYVAQRGTSDQNVP